MAKRKIKKKRVIKKRKIRVPKKVAPAAKKEDHFWDEDTGVNAEDAVVVNPTDWDIRDEVSGMDSFRDFARFNGGNSLTYGDY